MLNLITKKKCVKKEKNSGNEKVEGSKGVLIFGMKSGGDKGRWRKKDSGLEHLSLCSVRKKKVAERYRWI